MLLAGCKAQTGSQEAACGRQGGGLPEHAGIQAQLAGGAPAGQAGLGPSAGLGRPSLGVPTEPGGVPSSSTPSTHSQGPGTRDGANLV